MAPLIDVVFLLLIFFMLTSHFNVASGISIKLPTVTRKLYDRQDHRITLVIDKNGDAYIRRKKIPPKALFQKIRDMVQKDGGTVRLLLEADREVKHGRVVRVMDLAKRAGVSAIIIAARWDPRKAE